MNKKILTVILAVVICIGLFAFSVSANENVPEGIWTDYAAKDFGGGSGTKDDPYLLATAEQIAKLAADINSGVYDRDHSNEYFKLTDNIDLSAHRWIPIGSGTATTSMHAFRGYFDGDGHTVSGMYVDESDNKFSAGFFGNVSGRVIKNLTIKDAYVKSADTEAGYDGAGILIGNAAQGYGIEISVENCHVSGKVEGNISCGGLVGKNSYGVYKNCSSDVEINSDYFAGGFVGNDFIGDHDSCTSSGTVNGYYCVGGYAGQFFCESKANKCLSDAEVNGRDWHVGGFAGYVGYSEDDFGPCEITNCVALGDVNNTLRKGVLSKTGGFAGTNAECIIKNSHAAGKITVQDPDNNPAGGFVGYDTNGNVSDCSFDSEKNAGIGAIGDSNVEGDNKIAAADTRTVLANICVDYYGGHQPDEKLTVDREATCTEPGETSHHCKRCDAPGEEKTAIDPDGHELEKVEEKPATCTEPGYNEYWKCKKCEKLFSDENAEHMIETPEAIDVKGHKIVPVGEVPATCTENGKKAHYKCTECNAIFADENGQNEIEDENLLLTDKKAHDYKWIIDAEPTTEKEGSKHEECSVCHDKKASVSIPKITEPPKTGVSTVMVITAVFAVVSLAAAYICLNKKRARG